MVVYLDGVISLNFLVDWMLLLGVNRLAGFPAGFGRSAAAALVGGGYAGACLIPGFRFLSSVFWRIVSLGIVTMTAFGLSRSGFRRGVLFILLSMALGGLVLNFDMGNLRGLIVCSIALTLLCTLGFQRKAIERRLVHVKLLHDNIEHSFSALVDTGNSLRDPLTGERPLIVSPVLARKIMGLAPDASLDPASLVCQGWGIRLIPYRSVGGEGVMAAIRCESISIDGNMAGTLMAVSPQEFLDGEYQALTGGIYG